MTTRAMNCGGTLRLGVFGSLSLMSSPSASDGEDVARDGRAHEVERGAGEPEPAETCSPADDGGGHQGAKSGDDTDEKGVGRGWTMKPPG